MTGPNPNSIYPNENIRHPAMILAVHKMFGDRLIIGKFCAIARGIEFIIVYYERREPPHEQRNDLPLQHHGRRLGEVCPKAR